MHAGGGLFGHADDGVQVALVERGVGLQALLDGGEEDLLFFAAGVGQHRRILGGAGTQVQQQRGVAAVVQDHVGGLAVGPLEDGVGVAPVVFQRFTLHGEGGDAGGHHGGSGVVLRGEDVARGPAQFGAQGHEGFHQHGGLDGHVQRTGDACALERLGGSVFAADGHQAGHLGLGDLDFLAAPVGQGEIGDAVVFGSRCVHVGSGIGMAPVAEWLGCRCRQKKDACSRGMGCKRRFVLIRPSLARRGFLVATLLDMTGWRAL